MHIRNGKLQAKGLAKEGMGGCRIRYGFFMGSVVRLEDNGWVTRSRIEDHMGIYCISFSDLNLILISLDLIYS